MLDTMITQAVRDEVARLLGICTPAEEMLAVMAGEAFIRLPGVLALTGMSTANIYRAMAAKPRRFPLPVVLGPQQRAWRLSEIKQWQEERIKARDEGTDAKLRAVNPNIGRGRPPKPDEQHAA